jgi:hypothetical protein
MQTVLWAMGAMVVFMLGISFLPLGFTFKGKLFIAAAGFVLALGGIAAEASFPLWITFAILIILSFFAAYFMDSLIGKLLYVNDEKYQGDIEGFGNLNSSNKNGKEKMAELDIYDMDELDEVNSYVNLKESLSSSQTEETLNLIDETEVSFLEDRNPDKVVEVTYATDFEIEYLSEIESLLQEEKADQRQELLEKSWLEELDELTLTKTEEQNVAENLIDDIELELFIATSEVASGHDVKKSDRNVKEKVLLEK